MEHADYLEALIRRVVREETTDLRLRAENIENTVTELNQQVHDVQTYLTATQPSLTQTMENMVAALENMRARLGNTIAPLVTPESWTVVGEQKRYLSRNPVIQVVLLPGKREVLINDVEYAAHRIVFNAKKQLASFKVGQEKYMFKGAQDYQCLQAWQQTLLC